jgi:hypothetical protein
MASSVNVEQANRIDAAVREIEEAVRWVDTFTEVRDRGGLTPEQRDEVAAILTRLEDA